MENSTNFFLNPSLRLSIYGPWTVSSLSGLPPALVIFTWPAYVQKVFLGQLGLMWDSLDLYFLLNRISAECLNVEIVVWLAVQISVSIMGPYF